MTEFGKALRILRIEQGEILKDMASKLEVTPSYLSAIECGKRTIPENFIERICGIYHIAGEAKEKLEDAKARTENQIEIKIPFDGLTKEGQDLALKFARTFNNSNSEAKTYLLNSFNDFLTNTDKEEK